MFQWLDQQINGNKLIRRTVLATVLVLISITVLRATTPEVLTQATTAGGVIVTGILGLLTVGIKFYFDSRKADEDRCSK